MAKDKTSEERHTFRYKSALTFGSTSVVPLLLFLFVLERYGLIQESAARLALALSVTIAVLGFVFLLQIVRQVKTLADDFLRVERGELQELGERELPREFAEMARIADAFKKTLADMKAHTKELENLVNKLTTLSELTEMVARIPNIQEILQIVLRRTMATVNARIGSIMLLDEKNQTLSIAVAEGLEESVVAETTIHLGEGIAGKVAQTGEAVLVEDVEQDARFSKASDPKYETSSFICMPLRALWRVMGVLNLSKKGDRKAFSESDMNFLNTLISHIGFALENATLLREAKEAAVKFQEVVNEQSLQLAQAQQQVLQSAKLSALGELIAGVAHELNNPLTTMIGRSQLLLDKVQDGAMHRDLKRIFDQGQRAAKIVQNLLSFARQEAPEKRPCNINDIFRKVLEMRSYDLRLSNIEVRAELAPDLPTIMVDANQLQQVFLNIVNNAHQAMMEREQPRRLSIRTRRVGERLRVEFTDTGPGIAPEHQKRVFDPFFTIKNQSKGTGLGLSISYGIVKAHDGDIYVRSRVGEGATFIVELPTVVEAAAPATEEAHKARPSKPAMRKVLVVEDEETVNELITDILTDEGYQVDAVREGDQGLRKLLEEEYNLIVCDLRMPGMDGKRLYSQAKPTRPQLTQRFIFLTGDIVSEETRAFLEETGNLFIMKPFTKEALLGIVERAWQQIA